MVKDRSGSYVFPWYGDRSALVAHEDPHSRRYLKEALARAGYTADVCGDTRAILKPGNTAGHAFVILKSGEPGTEILRTLRLQGNQIPVILLSGTAPGKTAAPDPRIGRVAHLSAPFTLETLRVAIAKVCHFDPAGATPETDDR